MPLRKPNGIWLKAKKATHHFRTGDNISFQVALTDRGDRMTATNVKFLFNTALDKMLQKAKTENRFLGFIKIVEDEYFVKELQSDIMDFSRLAI